MANAQTPTKTHVWITSISAQARDSQPVSEARHVLILEMWSLKRSQGWWVDEKWQLITLMVYDSIYDNYILISLQQFSPKTCSQTYNDLSSDFFQRGENIYSSNCVLSYEGWSCQQDITWNAECWNQDYPTLQKEPWRDWRSQSSYQEAAEAQGGPFEGQDIKSHQERKGYGGRWPFLVLCVNGGWNGDI